MEEGFFAGLVKVFPVFMELEGSLPC